MTYSNCCGAVIYNTDYDLCPECLEHCDFEDDEEEESKAIPKLPSDEEIEKEYEFQSKNKYVNKPAFTLGAKWVIDKIKNQQ